MGIASKAAVLGASAIVVCACTGDSPDPAPAADAGTAPPTATPEGGAVGACDPAKDFQAPTTFAFDNVNTAAAVEEAQSLSSDELTVYFSRLDALGADLFVASRSRREDRFGAAQLFPATWNGPATDDRAPIVSEDGRTLYVTRTGVSAHVFRARRADDGTWSQPEEALALESGDSGSFEIASQLHDGELWYHTQAGIAHVPVDANGYGTPVTVPELGAALSPVLTADGTRIFFAIGTPSNGTQIMTATRAGAGPFGDIREVAAANSPRDELPRAISADGCRLYLATGQGMISGDLAVAERLR